MGINKIKWLIIMLGFIPFVSSSQEKNNSSRIKLSLNLFNPIQIPGNDKYFNDNWLIDNYGGTDNLPQKRKYTRLGMGIDIGYILKNKDCIILNFGLGYRKITESLISITPNPYSHPDEIISAGTKIAYKQNNYNVSLFYQSSIKIKLFEVYGAFGFSYLLQGKGKQDYFVWQTENVYPNMPPDSLAWNYNSEFAMGHNLGLGMRIGFSLNIYKNFKIGADFTNYFYYSFYDPKSIQVAKIYDRKVIDDGAGNITSVERVNSTSISESYTDFKQFSFTNISPCLKLIYDF